MTAIVRAWNGLVTGLFDLLFRPLRSWDPIWALLLFSLVVGVFMLWLFGKISNQADIKTVRDRIRGNLIAIRLFGDDVRLLFRLQGRILRDTLVYMKNAFFDHPVIPGLPILVLILVMLPILIQLNLRFAASPLTPGQTAIVNVKLRDAPAVNGDVRLEAPEGVTVETPGVRVPSLSEVSWRIRADRPGRYRLVVQAASEVQEKEVVVGEGWGATSTLRTGESLVQMLLYPGEPPIGPGEIASVELRYAPLSLELLGFNLNWLVVFFVGTLAFGFAFKRVLGVEI